MFCTELAVISSLGFLKEKPDQNSAKVNPLMRCHKTKS